jgi:hypothetical protein
MLFYEFLVQLRDLSISYATHQTSLPYNFEMHRWAAECCEAQVPVLGEHFHQPIPCLRGAGLEAVGAASECREYYSSHMDCLLFYNWMRYWAVKGIFVTVKLSWRSFGIAAYMAAFHVTRI